MAQFMLAKDTRSGEYKGGPNKSTRSAGSFIGSGRTEDAAETEEEREPRDAGDLGTGVRPAVDAVPRVPAGCEAARGARMGRPKCSTRYICCVFGFGNQVRKSSGFVANDIPAGTGPSAQLPLSGRVC
mmetsp:Transcript_131443/g.281062  ORF Transcript_131443/g.281062 Transcript_131443/m.281062 type:complete len:128 (-) Transcript_131443:22-405(-)